MSTIAHYPCIIIWSDASSCTSEKPNLIRRHDIGFFINANKIEVTIAKCFREDIMKYTDFLTIPTSQVEQIIYLIKKENE